MTPFAEAGPDIYARGYSPIPIMPASKMPGQFMDGSWKLFKGWNEYCLHRPTQWHISQWSSWPNAGVGVALGRGLICIDIDQEYLLDPILAILPPSPVQKKGRKGVSLFYRGDTDKIRSRNYRTDERVGLLDLLSEGKQTILPPSIHPDTNEPYFWWGDLTLADVPLSELPELPNDIAEQIAEVLKPFGYDPDRERAEIAVALDVDERSAGVGQFYRKLNEDALSNLHAWVPELKLPKGRFQGRVYRAVAPWRGSSSGRPMARRSTNLSLSPGGIEDFGTGERFTALNLVMKALEIPESSLDTAVEWLGGRLGYDFSEAELVNGPKTLERIRARDAAAAPVATRKESLQVQTPATVPTLPVGELSPETVGDEGEETFSPCAEKLEAMVTNVPGLVGEIVEWIVASSERPSRPLAFGAAIVLVGTLIGRIHIGPSELRTNLYVVGLAESAYGKAAAPKMCRNLIAKAGLTRFLGSDDFRSDSGLRKVVEEKLSFVSYMDELGNFVRKMMNRRGPQHETAIRHMLLKLYTMSNDTYTGSASAAEGATPIYNPCFSIYGTTTPEDFWKSMTSDGVADGLLPRWLILTITGPKPAYREPTMSGGDPPERLVEWCKALVSLSYKGQNLAASGTRAIDHIKASWGEGANARRLAWTDVFAARSEKLPTGSKELWTRCVENALRIAHIVAVGINPEQPVITVELVDWAVRLCEYSTKACIDGVQDRLALTDKQAEYLMVKRLIKETGKEGMSKTVLQRRINGQFDGARLKAIIDQLQDTQLVEFRPYQNPDGGRPGHRYFHL